MLEHKMSRRRFLATTAASSVALAMPHVRGAYAAGKLSLGLWDHWVPGANNATTALINEWADKEKVEVCGRLHPFAGQQAPDHRHRRGAGAIGARHPLFPELAAGGSCPQPGAGRRHHGAVDQGEWRRHPGRGVSRQGRRQVARGALNRRQPDQGPVLAHRPLEAARRDRRASHVPRRRAAQGGRLDARCSAQGGGSMPQGRLCHLASGLARPPIQSTPQARFSNPSAQTSSTPKAISRSKPTPYAKRSTIMRGSPVSSRRILPPGTIPRTTNGSSPGAAP